MMILNSRATSSRKIRFGQRALFLWVLLFPFVCQATTLSGVIRNKTTNKPDAGDDVVLIALTQSMQEVARTRTDSAGRYSLVLPDAAMHLIRVVHQKASYFAAVPPGKNRVDLDVFDVEPKLSAVKTQADMLRVETDDHGLHVLETFFVDNNSAPPQTQFGPSGYEFFLPDGAQIDAAQAMGPGGMPVSSPPVPQADKGHYSFLFPLRPGESRFEVSYHIPYSGSYTFHSRVALPIGSLAIALPKSMKFDPGSSDKFQPLNDDQNAQTFLAKDVLPAQPVTFTVSGNGALPKEASEEQNTAPPTATVETQSETAPSTVNRPGMGLGPPSGAPDPLDKYKWWLLGGIVLVFTIGAALFLRARASLSPDASDTVVAPVPSTKSALLNALKEELFAVETERLRGTLTELEYSDQRAALETVLKHALVRHT